MCAKAIDTSQLIWVTTANDGRAIPAPILNRMNVYEAAHAPDRDTARRIIAKLYRGIRADHGRGERFETVAARRRAGRDEQARAARCIVCG